MDAIFAAVVIAGLAVATLRQASAVAFGRDGGALLRWVAGRDDVRVPRAFKPLALAAAASVPLLLFGIGLVGLWYPVEKSADDALICTRPPAAAVATCTLADTPEAAPFVVKDIEVAGGAQRVVGAEGQTIGALLSGQDPFAFRRNVAHFHAGKETTRLAGHFSKQPHGPFLPLHGVLLLIPWLGASLAWGRKLRAEGAVPPSASASLPVGVPAEAVRAPPTSTRPTGGARYASAWAPLATPLSVALVAAPLAILLLLPSALFEQRSAWRLATGLVDSSLLFTGTAVLTAVTLVVLAVWARAVLGRRAGVVWLDVATDARRISWQRVGPRKSERVTLVATRPVPGSSRADMDYEHLEVVHGDDVASIPGSWPDGTESSEVHVRFVDGTVARLSRRG